MNVRVYVTPKKGILDPQGATVERALPNLGFSGVSDVRIGKFIEFRLDPPPGTTLEQARATVDEMCRKLLANPIIEDFTFTVDEG
ncbi:MAG TPA: phosphoribosylformylglycinamidine synthase subunit PurS [Thermoleophilia bacterium]|nr:phosphoribosylformylglycinamidine synthase subunit PurS [Thermoleophilia bacterium]HQG04200.1 phosphoribosylformylglycinamidine synthase subunit PurS [Thermoleophilia bacterium]HQG54230.1 phosphoribosylformylglycinamidine synthase subunit PurS [Thermoleophilia bacterium]HQJ97866.1 phosphoribosylformylglycinamidine synthase subunit PurS [Thermoleophilia bacterium]